MSHRWPPRCSLSCRQPQTLAQCAASRREWLENLIQRASVRRHSQRHTNFTSNIPDHGVSRALLEHFEYRLHADTEIFSRRTFADNEAVTKLPEVHVGGEIQEHK